MIQKNKDLLLQDLCGRLSHGVKCKVWYNDKTLNIKCTGIDFYTNTVNLDIPGDDNAKVYVDNIKPYLFPLSSMTEEQKIIYGDLCYAVIHSLAWDMQAALNELIDWLNKNHFDYRGLIEKGLAVNATGLNIY